MSPAVRLQIQYGSSYGRSVRQKTVALLQRGQMDNLKVSVSGWSEFSAEPYQLNSNLWTSRVFELCKVVGHILPETPSRDQGVAGRYAVCHAEKQLVAYYWYRHSTYEKKRTLHVSRQPCEDCVLFLRQVKNVLGLSVRVIVNGTRVPY
ncbi:hypothetical protein LTR36_009021 [Oleoguttula mirabilis]|uniref:Single-strand DNA deaminase toxin A-like C-terminal domain-containing protein n=1 Tax=Oleoguttula mirabilis TaxID=1507867 RepID=A0AAV9J8H2_9PEZI|nr:hypothetical protein LTR36_009021 [Oleoguttula mirabilis]